MDPGGKEYPGKYLWMDTERAKKCYDATTGKIGEGITGYDQDWWFCETIPGKFPKFPSLNICGDKTMKPKSTTVSTT